MEKCAIHIGNIYDKVILSNLASFVKDVFDSGRSNNMDQATVIAALNLFKQLTPENITIQNCHFKVGEEAEKSGE